LYSRSIVVNIRVMDSQVKPQSPEADTHVDLAQTINQVMTPFLRQYTQQYESTIAAQEALLKQLDLIVEELGKVQRSPEGELARYIKKIEVLRKRIESLASTSEMINMRLDGLSNVMREYEKSQQQIAVPTILK
jgi:uncharacterized protein involved in exopolysaccharide biosynthesis